MQQGKGCGAEPIITIQGDHHVIVLQSFSVLDGRQFVGQRNLPRQHQFESLGIARTERGFRPFRQSIDHAVREPFTQPLRQSFSQPLA